MHQLEHYLLSFCILGIFLLIGKYCRVHFKVFQRLFLPSAIIAGFMALILGPFGFNLFPEWLMEHWNQLPQVLINVVFACLFLGVALPNVRTIWQIGGPQICYGTFMGVGQYFIAIMVTLIILIPFFDVSPLFSCIVEIGFSGGHGTAAGMQKVFNELGFHAGSALSQMSATVGIVYAVIAGIILVNIAIRKGHCTYLNKEKGIPTYKKIGLIPEPKRFSIATATVATEAIEPLTFHIAVMGVAILIGQGLLYLVKMIHPSLNGFPLFPLAMIGGFVIQGISTPTGVSHYFDRDTFERIIGVALDFLVISAIASIRLDLFWDNIWPFMIIMLAGVLWPLLCTLYIAPRMFPEHWFERSITEFGMQTGVTAIGLLLLRLVDPINKTKTAEAFGVKQLLYHPFLGGGIITATAPFLIINFGLVPVAIVSFIIMIFFLALAYVNGWLRLKKF